MTLPDRRLIDLTEDQLREIVFSALATFAPAASGPPAELLDKQGAAKMLKISISKLDGLSRQPVDPLPYRTVGSVRRYFRADVLAWVARQPSND